MVQAQAILKMAKQDRGREGRLTSGCIENGEDNAQSQKKRRETILPS